MTGSYEDCFEMNTLSQVIDDEPMLKITSDFDRLGNRCYLENAGAALYPQSLLVTVNNDLMGNVYMNPHSDKYTKDCIEQIRSMVLKHFNTDSSSYTVVFTSGTTHGLKLVAESFRFHSEGNDLKHYGSFVYLRDAHTSVLGLREIAKEKSADIIHVSHEDFLNAVNGHEMKPISWKDKFRRRCEGNTLFVYPAQSNYNGYKYPTDCVEILKNGCLNKHLKKKLCQINNNWYVLLDAAAYVSTSKLDLSKTQPDYVALSFYKIFGYPTGLGALLIKNTSQDVLNQKNYYGGGTVDFVLSTENFFRRRKNFNEGFEDGTQSFLSIIALKHCFDTLHKLIPKTVHDNVMDTISYHTFYLAKDLYHQLKELRHINGTHAVVLYMDSDFSDIKQQGGIVTFNLLREDGSYIGYSAFQHMADLFNISVRTGCFCNSGSCQRHLLSSNKEMKDSFKAGHICGDEFDIREGRPTGAIRVSFGYFNTFQDIDKLLNMICKCFVKGSNHSLVRHRSRSNTFTLKRHSYNNIISDTYNQVDYRSLDYKQLRKQINGVKYNTQIKVTNQEYIENHNFKLSNNGQPNIVVKEAAIFPIKSCGAFKIRTSWKIGLKGFEYDREWMIIKDNGVCLTQKNNSKMCMILPKIDLKHKTMTLHFKGKSSITIPLDHSSKVRETTFCQTRVCTDSIRGHDCGDEVADWISEALEISYLRLIRQSSGDKRLQRSKDGDQNYLSLSNQAQFLLVNQATIRWLRNKIDDPLFVDSIDHLTDRFRSNIVIDMDTELEEREWQSVTIGKQHFKVNGLCTRCSMVCIDQHTGTKTVEPLRTIGELFQGKLRFGIYLSYVGPTDGSQDHSLQVLSPVHPVRYTDDNITR